MLKRVCIKPCKYLKIMVTGEYLSMIDQSPVSRPCEDDDGRCGCGSAFLENNKAILPMFLLTSLVFSGSSGQEIVTACMSVGSICSLCLMLLCLLYTCNLFVQDYSMIYEETHTGHGSLNKLLC